MNEESLRMSPKDQSWQDKSEIKIKVLENGYIMKTRSGWYVYLNRDALKKEFCEYLDVVEKERNSKNLKSG